MRKDSWTNEEDCFLKEHYLKLSRAEIEKTLERRTWNAIVRRAWKFLKLGNRSKVGLFPRKYYWDFNFFHEIDTQEKAYWLGFIYADGSIDERNRFRMGLVTEGEKHLSKFAIAISYNGQIKIKTTKNGKKRYSIVLCHPAFSKDLKKAGVTYRKTWSIQYPHWLPVELSSHFIRGVFDGDGCITINKKRNISTFSICGASKNFLEDIVLSISEHTRNNPVKVILRKNTKTYSFSWQGKKTIQIRDWLYKEATTYMDCKKEKFHT